MLKAAWGLLRDSGWILLEAAPKAMDLERMRAHLLATEHVHSLHDLHAWTVTSSLPALSRTVIDDANFTDGCAPRLLDELQACIAGHFDVEHPTFQPYAIRERRTRNPLNTRAAASARPRLCPTRSSRRGDTGPSARARFHRPTSWPPLTRS